MKKTLVFALLFSVLLLLSACAPKLSCAEPNKIIGNECCLDENDDDVCDYAEEEEAEPDEEPEIDSSYNKRTVTVDPEPESESAPEIDTSYNAKVPEPEPAALPNTYELGKSDIRQGEPRDWIQVHELSAYRTSRDKGYMDYMVYTVRNLGATKKRLEVQMFFEHGLTAQGTDTRVGKTYTIDELKPGEKVTMKQSLGIFFRGIEESKTLSLSIYDPFVVPNEDIDVLKKTFRPSSIFEDMEIYQYGKDE